MLCIQQVIVCMQVCMYVFMYVCTYVTIMYVFTYFHLIIKVEVVFLIKLYIYILNVCIYVTLLKCLVNEKPSKIFHWRESFSVPSIFPERKALPLARLSAEAARINWYNIL